MEIIKSSVGKILYIDLGYSVVLDLIYIEPEFRGQRYGDRLLSQFIHTFGDRDIIVSVSAEFGSSLERLVKWYKRFGFSKIVSGSYWHHNRMERKANAKNKV